MRHKFSELLGVPRYFRVQENTFNAVGINLNSYEFDRRNFAKTCLTSTAVVLLIIAMAVYAFEHGDDIKLVTQSLSPFLEFVLLIWKLWLLIFNRLAYVRLIKNIQKMCLKATKDELAIIAEENLRDTRLSGIYYYSVMGAATTAVLAAVGKFLLNYLKTGEFQFVTVFTGEYFLDQTIPLNAIIITIWTVAAMHLGANTSIAVDSLYSWYVFNIAAQFRILHLKMAALTENVTEADLKLWISSHQEKLDLAKEFNRIFAPVILVHFALNSVQICFIAFQFNAGISLAELPFLLIFFVAVMIQSSIYCFGGELLENESVVIANVIFEYFPWHTAPVKLVKLMQFALQRSQRACKLTGIFFEVNLRLFLWVVRTAASYMTLLWSLQ